MSVAAAALAIREAARGFVGRAATPAVVDGVKLEFVRIMRERYGVDLGGHVAEIEVGFGGRGEVYLEIAPGLLEVRLQ